LNKIQGYGQKLSNRPLFLPRTPPDPQQMLLTPLSPRDCAAIRKYGFSGKGRGAASLLRHSIAIQFQGGRERMKGGGLHAKFELKQH